MGRSKRTGRKTKPELTVRMKVTVMSILDVEVSCCFSVKSKNIVRYEKTVNGDSGSSCDVSNIFLKSACPDRKRDIREIKIQKNRNVRKGKKRGGKTKW